jgi:hypothetical protein
MASIFERLRVYFQGVADALDSEKTAASIFPHRSNAGSSREDIILEFIASHIPSRCHATRGGFIFDSKGRESGQIDLLITNDITLQFKQFDRNGRGQAFNCIEGCYAAISVKTKLTKPALYDALDNIASIPQMPDPGERLSPIAPDKKYYMNLPYKVIYAFDGVSIQKITSHLNEYYSSRDIQPNRKPDLIVVNNKYIIIHPLHDGLKFSIGTPVPSHQFCGLSPKFVGGYSLVFMLSNIQNAANFGTSLLMNFDDYINQIPFTSAP